MKAIAGRQLDKSFFFFFEILSHLNQAVPNHPADESQTEDGPVVYPASAFDSRLRGD